jgi:hypothetical protein
MVADGPDKPFFDVLMSGQSNILAVGAYFYFVRFGIKVMPNLTK